MFETDKPRRGEPLFTPTDVVVWATIKIMDNNAIAMFFRRSLENQKYYSSVRRKVL